MPGDGDGGQLLRRGGGDLVEPLRRAGGLGGRRDVDSAEERGDDVALVRVRARAGGVSRGRAEDVAGDGDGRQLVGGHGGILLAGAWVLAGVGAALREVPMALESRGGARRELSRWHCRCREIC